ncbi:hypothetical protein VPH35_002097 [Triticum aestivum]
MPSHPIPHPRETARRRGGPRRRSPLSPHASSFLSILLLSPPLVHPRRPGLTMIHGPLLLPASVHRGSSVALDLLVPRRPYCTTHARLLIHGRLLPSRRIDVGCHDQPLAQLVHDVGASVEKKRGREMSREGRRINRGRRGRTREEKSREKGRRRSGELQLGSSVAAYCVVVSLKLTCWNVYAQLKLAHSVLHISNSLQNF